MGLNLTTLGAKFGYAVETVAGQRPTEGYNEVSDCLSAGGVALSASQVDVSTLIDKVTRYRKGRSDTGGTWDCTFLTGGMTDLELMISEYEDAALSGKGMWFVLWFEGLEKSYFVKAAPPTLLALGDVSSDSPIEIPVSFVLEEVAGFLTAIEPN